VLGVAARFSDYRQAIDKSGADAVAIVTPTFLHREIAVAAAAAGKHVFLEKPMAVTVDECRAIIDAAQAANVKLQIGFMRRFDQGFLRAKELLDSGELGRVMLIKSTGRGPGGPGPWMWDLAKSNGIIAEVNSHDLDSLNWYTGSTVRQVYAQAHNFKMPEAKAHFPDFYDNVVAQLRFADDTLGVVDGTCPAHYGYDARVEILCERGVVFVGSAREHAVEYITVEAGVRADAVKSWRNLFQDAYRAEVEHFAQCVIEDRPPRVTGRDGLRAVAAVVAINESIRTGQPVHVEEPSGLLSEVEEPSRLLSEERRDAASTVVEAE
jgi:myo-inositol 2-dehydrogenase/D-chiro-inositol 1-dehydrogenase/scyllo-inositol 2-dehydrogenase (NAD+)